MTIFKKYKNHMQDRINTRNRSRLINENATLISSNCTGGFIYHWLGMQFTSPFINLYVEPDDFVVVCKNLEHFINGKIDPVSIDKPYPVGRGEFGVLIHFMHYKSFEEAYDAWRRRAKRINYNNMGLILSNWGGYDLDTLYDFDQLSYKNKVIFTDKEFLNVKSAVCLKGYSCTQNNVYATNKSLSSLLTCSRYIDQFDYVGWINSFML